MAKIILIHAVQIAMLPIEEAFKQSWPDAELVNILDESLGTERANTRFLTPKLFKRVSDLTDMAIEIDADAVLFTCSAFGEAIEEVAKRVCIPVLKPNEAMFKTAMSLSKNIAMIATFQPAVEGMEKEFRDTACDLGVDVLLTSVCEPMAKAALNIGEVDKHNALITDLAMTLKDIPVLMLAHFSTSIAKRDVEMRTGKIVLTSPDSAVEMLKQLLK